MHRPTSLATAVQLAVFATLAVVGGMLGQQLTQPAAVADASAERGTRVAVADISQLFYQSQRTKRAQNRANEELAAQNKRFRSERDALVLEVKALEEIKDSKPAEYRAKMKELMKKDHVFGAKLKWAKQEYNDKVARLTEEVYEDIRREIGKYAREKGIDLVLKIYDLPEQMKQTKSVQSKINRKHILYRARALDITKPVLERLNASE